MEGLEPLGSPREHRAHHLGNDIASPAHPDHVALANVFSRDLPSIVQSGIAHRHPSHQHGLETRHRRECTGPTDLHLDGEQPCRDLLGGKLVGRGEPGCTRHKARYALGHHGLQLDHSPIDLKVQGCAIGLKSCQKLQHVLEARLPRAPIRNRNAPALQLKHPIRVTAGVCLCGSPLTQAVGHEAQWTRGSDRWVELTKASCGRIARVRKELFTQRELTRVDLGEVGLAHEGLTANLEHRWPALSGQLLGNTGHGANIGRDIFTLRAISTRGGLHQLTCLVAKAQRQAIDLRLNRIPQRPVLCRHQRGQTGIKAQQRGLIEDVLQGQHWQPMGNGSKLPPGGGPNTLNDR